MPKRRYERLVVMKTKLILNLSILGYMFFLGTLSFAGPVGGYTRHNGIYVAPYMRSDPMPSFRIPDYTKPQQENHQQAEEAPLPDNSTPAGQAFDYHEDFHDHF